MIKAIHIKLLLLFSLSILFGHSAFAQNQQVCVGQEVTYHMYGFDGSSVQWSINTTPAVDITHTIDASNGVLHPPHSDPNYFKDSFTHTWTAAGTYTIQIVESNNSCDSDPITFTVEVHDLPDNSYVLGSPTICKGEVANISLSDSQIGVNYQLRLEDDDSNVGTVVAGTGGAISFNVNPTVTTTYNVLATNTSTTCISELTSKSTVTVKEIPTTNLTISSTSTCLGDDGLVTIENYEADVTYTLYVDGNLTAFTPSPNVLNMDLIIDATNLITATDYTITIKAEKNACLVDMDNGSILTVKPVPILGNIE